MTAADSARISVYYHSYNHSIRCNWQSLTYPILMQAPLLDYSHGIFFGRLLYGRMQRWTGAGTGGKAGAGARRSVVLRFIASCPSSEMKIFMDLILAPFKHLYDGM